MCPHDLADEPLHHQDAPADPAEESAPRRVFRSRFTVTWLSGLVLASCLFLPACRGCNDDIYPAELWVEAWERLPQDGNNYSLVAGAYFWTWHYLAGFLIALCTLAAAVSGRPAWFTWLWRMLAAGTLFWSLLIWQLLAGSEIDGDDWLFIAIAICATAAVLLCSMNARSWLSAASLMQTALATVSVAWFALLSFAGEALIGVYAALAAAFALAVSSVVQWRYAARVHRNAVTRRLARARGCYVEAPGTAPTAHWTAARSPAIGEPR